MIRWIILAQLLLPGFIGFVEPGSVLPDGCVWGSFADSAVCSWEFDVAVEDTEIALEPDIGEINNSRIGPDFSTQTRWFEIPAFPRSIATITVELDGQQGGWHYWIAEKTASGPYHFAASRNRFPEPNAFGAVQRDTAAHIFYWHGNETQLAFDPMASIPLGGASFGPAAFATRGHVSLRYEVIRAPIGHAPAHPPATREDPHLLGTAGDSEPGAMDLAAVWFDDRMVGDEAFEIIVAVRNLSDDGPDGDELSWSVSFNVLGRAYRALWVRHYAGDRDNCYLTDFRGEEASQKLSWLPCFFDEKDSTLHAEIAERSVGAPGDGVLFENMRATSDIRRDVSEDPGAAVFQVGFTDPVVRTSQDSDVIEGESYPFALGGPAIWDELNPQLASAMSPWYREPFTAENLPNTLQVAGAAAAIFTFFAGLIIVARRRSRLKKLLAEVDALARVHAQDARTGLLALGAFEEALDEKLHRGRITESEYQTASQRIARAASRLTMRRDLGLDDGLPGTDVDIGVRR